MKNPVFKPLIRFHEYPPQEMKSRVSQFFEEINRRRTVRQFSERDVRMDVIEDCIRAAATAPSGANMQPWHFVVVTDPEIKKQIRQGAEKEEHRFYTEIAPQEWLDALAPLGTNENKPFLEQAPVLIVIFSQSYGLLEDGRKVKNYYVSESVGIATGILITAVHHAGLVSLTHTPSPMAFLNRILQRPPQEKPFLILVVGYPAADASVPDISRKHLSEVITSFHKTGGRG